jgi:hypothetical protein
MAASSKPFDWRVIIRAGLFDVLLGLGLLGGSLTGFFGPDMQPLAIVGGVMAVAGLGIVALGRYKLRQVADRLGDLN